MMAVSVEEAFILREEERELRAWERELAQIRLEKKLAGYPLEPVGLSPFSEGTLAPIVSFRQADVPQDACPKDIPGIVAWVEQRHCLQPGAILERSRKPRVVRARWEAMRRMSDGEFSSPAIGKVFGLDHTSVLYGVKQARALGL